MRHPYSQNDLLELELKYRREGNDEVVRLIQQLQDGTYVPKMHSAGVMKALKPRITGRKIVDVERELVLNTYRDCDRNRALTAQTLGISPKALSRRLQSYGALYE